MARERVYRRPVSAIESTSSSTFSRSLARRRWPTIATINAIAAAVNERGAVIDRRVDLADGAHLRHRAHAIMIVVHAVSGVLVAPHGPWPGIHRPMLSVAIVRCDRV